MRTFRSYFLRFCTPIILLLWVLNSFAQNQYRLIKNNYFTENRTFPEFVATNNLKQVTTKEGNLTRTITYDKKGDLLQDIYTSDFKLYTNEDDTYGTYSTSGFSTKVISPLSTKPSHIPVGYGDFYIGYLEVGTYYTKDGLIFTGFMLPTLKEFGNGSVLFMEDPKNKKCAWALIVDGNIDWTIPANIEEKPDVETLHRSFNMNFKIIAELPRKRLHLKEKNNPVANEFINELLMVNITPKNTTNFNGYGLHLNQNSKVAVADEVQVFVGHFKDNVLNGLGYYATINNTFRPVTMGNNRKIQITEQSVSAMFGYFKQNSLLQGRTIDAQNQPKDTDFWSATSYPGILYSKYEKNRKTPFPESQKLSELPAEINIYLPSVDREFVAIVDKKNGVLRIRSDFNTEDKIKKWQCLDGKNEMVYYRTKNSFSTDQKCEKEVKKPIYDTKHETYVAYYEHSSKRYETNFGSYIRVYRTTSSLPVYKTKEVGYFTGQYKTEKCPYCKGTGVIHHLYTETVYKPILFDLPQYGIHTLTGLDKQNLYGKENYMTIKTQMVFKDCTETTSDLNFTVQIIDELARNEYGDNEQAKTKVYAGIVDELVFFEEPKAAEKFLRYFGTVRRTLIVDALNLEAKNHFKNIKW